MTPFRLSIACVAFALLASPAIAAPNVFWTFGFDPGYAHGAGGRAEAPSSLRMAGLERPSSSGTAGSKITPSPASPDVRIALSQSAVTEVMNWQANREADRRGFAEGGSM